MKKLLLVLLVLPIFCFGQVNTFPWVNDFESFITLEQDPNDNGDWWLMQGPTTSYNTGPSGDHTTGNGIYYYVESSSPNYPNKTFVAYTPTFDVSATPGKVLSFWYHMYGASMGDLEIGVLDGSGYTSLDVISGNQGDYWHFAYYPITAVDSFKIAFVATTGASFTSDICIDDLMVSDPFTVIYGCMDTISSNYDSTATINAGCIYYYGCTDSEATNYNPWANVDDGSCVQEVVCNQGQSLIDIAITLDNWPSETSWLIYSATDTFASVPYGTYDYTQTGQTIHTQVCIPVATQIMFTINDTYGDGIGGGSVVGGCLVTNLDCEDTVFYLNPPNFGYTASSNVYTSASCNNDTTIYGCMDDRYLEYDSLATDDDGSCVTLAAYGCTDPLAFNYNPLADRMLLTSPCTYNLTLYDDGGDSWGDCWLGVKQGDSLWQFKISGNGIYSETFALTLNSYDEVEMYYFEIATPQQNAQQLDIQTIQNSFKLENGYGVILYEGNNPWPGPNENKLRNYKSALDIYSAQPYCGDQCIPVVTGCMDAMAFNYNALANTNDTCYYSPGCTNVGYLEYYTQGYTADVDDGSCSTVAVFGCTDSLAFNYNTLANVDNGGCVAVVTGCMQPLAFNYNPQANTPDTCIAIVYGCMSSIAINYDSLANTDDGSCIGVVYGCTDSSAFNYSPSANADDGSCVAIVYGCMDPTMFNYDILANTDNNSCIAFVYGCMDTTAFNYDPLANTDNGSCVPYIYGCTNPIALNYDAAANVDDGSCVTPIYGCTDSTMFNYNSLANADNGSCIPFIYGCTNPNAINYDPLANTDDLSCIGTIYGCTDSTAYNYNPLANFDNNSCIPVILGCTDPSALNYDFLANTDDFSCILPIYGCMDSLAFNYNSLANVDNGSCVPVILGCTDPIALNYCDTCNTDDFSCILPIYGCTDSTMFNYNPLANVDNSSCVPYVFGCTNPSMLNYDPLANTEDFTCIPYIYGCMDSTALNYDSLANTDNESCITIVEGCMDQSAYNYDVTANVHDSISCLFAASCVTGPGNPYWLNDPCYAWVISIDDYCCHNSWDEVCQSTYDYCYNSWTGPILSRKLDDNIVVYPNPTQGIININKNVNINIFNSIGDMIISETDINVLDVTILTPGIYTLQIMYNNKIVNKRIIKQ